MTHRQDAKPKQEVKPEPKAESKTPKKGQVQKFDNGFAIEYVGIGQPDGAIAKPGKKCTMRYVGRLQKNGKVFDQTKGKSTFSFRLAHGKALSKEFSISPSLAKLMNYDVVNM
eukprot:scaffold664640_cov52-Prasinocladus_malaysianus.AAC.1